VARHAGAVGNVTKCIIRALIHTNLRHLVSPKGIWTAGYTICGVRITQELIWALTQASHIQPPSEEIIRTLGVTSILA